MISILTQERLLGFALGSALTAAVVFENRRQVHRSISEINAKFGDQPQIMKPVFERQPKFEVAHLWNKAVDKTFGTMIASLSSRGCVLGLRYVPEEIRLPDHVMPSAILSWSA
ncbi:hypothetical protein KSS87_017289, partial [Heliosperma pusillum]